MIEDVEERGRSSLTDIRSFPTRRQSTLDVLPSEIEPEIPENAESILLSYYPPTEDTPKRFLMKRPNFDHLAGQAGMPSVLEDALRVQREAEEERRPTRRRRGETPPAERIDYTSPEHAGEPRRGTVSAAEQEYVQGHLAEVNQRLARDGHRRIDPTDLRIAERYGLSTTGIPGRGLHR